MYALQQGHHCHAGTFLTDANVHKLNPAVVAIMNDFVFIYNTIAVPFLLAFIPAWLYPRIFFMRCSNVMAAYKRARVSMHDSISRSLAPMRTLGRPGARVAPAVGTGQELSHALPDESNAVLGIKPAQLLVPAAVRRSASKIACAMKEHSSQVGHAATEPHTTPASRALCVPERGASNAQLRSFVAEAAQVPAAQLQPMRTLLGSAFWLAPLDSADVQQLLQDPEPLLGAADWQVFLLVRRRGACEAYLVVQVVALGHWLLLMELAHIILIIASAARARVCADPVCMSATSSVVCTSAWAC